MSPFNRDYSSQTISKAVQITRYSHTDFMSVMNMSYEMIDVLYNGLADVLKEEAEAQSKR